MVYINSFERDEVMKKKAVMATILVATSIVTTFFTGCSSNVGTNKDKKQIVFFSNKI